MMANQLTAYPEFDDVQENFLIDSSGGLIEGRGFQREGQLPCESHTCYNNKAVSINFILNENDNPSAMQLDTLCTFTRHFIDTKDLDSSYTIFLHSQLTSSYFDNQEEVELATEICQLNFKRRNAI